MDLDDLNLDDIGNNDFFGNLDEAGLEEGKRNKKTQKVTPTLGASEAAQKLNSISKQTLQALEKDAILPLPENFEAYFEKTLSQEEDERVREKIKAIVESANHDSRLIALEKVFNDNFATLKTILEHLLTLCKRMSAMERNTDKRLLEIASITNPLGAQNAIKVLVNEMKGFHKDFVVQADLISRAYRNMYAQSSTIKSGAIYDSKLGIYTHSFLTHALDLECENGKDFPRHCAVVVFAPSKELASQINEQSKLITIFKSIARIVSKNIGTKDIVSYLGSGYFGMLLKNVQPDAAITLCQEVIQKCKVTNLFIDDVELHLCIVMGGVVLDVNKTPEMTLKEAKEQLELAQKEGVPLKFAQGQAGNTHSSDDSEEDSFELPGDGFDDLADFDLS
ncbi:diguanylate cyclase domain-containing protein [Helicobacter japonicus]|uniref:GGDEF domain-containing protein n=2 Tax=Helicobacter japonicus TaxID=425400 RepID=A0A4U8TLZ2_9HELI|nr:diguanylate cyclase [Helicobacter japonicus]TLE01026.1 GGDEF domain-containing protein [Helicobacter japonicus]